jgi:hypothetical protein
VFGGVYIANEGFTKDQANTWLAEGKADAVALVACLQQDAPMSRALKPSTVRTRMGLSTTPRCKRTLRQNSPA